MSKTAGYSKILTDEIVKNFALKIFCEYFKSTREKLYPKLGEWKIFEKLLNRFLFFLTMPDKVEIFVKLIEKMPEAKMMMQSSLSDIDVYIYNVDIFSLFDTELQLFNTKAVIKNTLKELLGELKKSRQFYL